MIEDQEEMVVTPTLKGDQNLDRMTIHFTLHHESGCCATPFTVSSPCTKYSKQQVRPYERPVKLKPSWSKIDIGWIEEEGATVGWLVLQNKLKQLTGAEFLSEEKRPQPVIEISVRGDDHVDFEVGPGEFFFVAPKDLPALSIRSSDGILPVSYSVIPR